LSEWRNKVITTIKPKESLDIDIPPENPIELSVVSEPVAKEYDEVKQQPKSERYLCISIKTGTRVAREVSQKARDLICFAKEAERCPC